MPGYGQRKVSRLAMLTTRRTGLQIQRVIFLAALLLPGTASHRLAAQTHPDFLKLASDTSRRIAKTHTQRILIALLEGCLLDMAICEADEATLSAALEKEIPGVQFINHDKLVSQVKKSGLLAIDAFDGQVVRSLGTETGAETLVSVNMKWDGNHYQLI
jgi:hypothetical protein